MAGLGIIATVGAFANFKRRKKELNALIEKRDALVAVINTFNNTKYDPYIDTIDTKPTEKPDGVSVSTLLRVANLVGQLMYVRASVILSNTSDHSYFIHYVAAECKLYGLDVAVKNLRGITIPQKEIKTFELKAGDTLEIQLPKGISTIGDYMGRLRDDICSAAGKRLITSCPKLNLEGIEQADIMVDWSDNNSFSGTQNWRIQGKPGILRYCGEAGLG